MRLRSAFFGMLAASLSGFGAVGAPATSDQAATIASSLQRYLGAGTPGAAPVTVTPTGETYTIAVDVAAMLHALRAFGATIAPFNYLMVATPEPDGTWRVTSDGQQQLSAQFKGQTFRFVVNGLKSTGLFDPSIPAFTTSDASYDSTSLASLDGKGALQTREQRQGRQTMTAKSVGDGVVDLDLKQTSAGISQDITADPAGAGIKAVALGNIGMKTGATETTATFRGLKIRALSDLWAFLVAHPDPAAIQAAQSDLRDLLRRALPLLQNLSQGGTAKDVSVVSPVGTFSAQSIAGRLEVAGLTADGRAESETVVQGLTIPAGLVPAWASDLIPTSVDLKPQLSGYRLDAAASEAINSFDLSKAEPLPPDAIARIRNLVGPLDKMRLTIAPSRITSKLIDLAVEGTARFAQPLPDLNITLHAKGVDEAIRTVQNAAGTDRAATQAIALMVLAKGYGKAEPDGSLTWVVANNPAGGVTVNGVALPGMGR